MSSIQDMLDYILEALKNKVVTKIEVEEATGIDKSTLYRWQEGLSMPRYEKVERIYQYIRKRRESQTTKLKFYIDLKGYRREQGITQNQIQRETGIAESRISRYETGKHISDELTEVFLSKLRGIQPYVVVNRTGKAIQDIQENVVNKLYGLSPQKMALVQGFIGRLMVEGVDMKQIQESGQILLKTTDLLRIKCDNALVEVDIDSYAPSISKGDKLHIALYVEKDDKLANSTLVLVTYQNDEGERQLTIGEIYERINKEDPSMRYAHIEHGDIHKAPLWIEWQSIIHIYRICSHIRQIAKPK